MNNSQGQNTRDYSAISPSAKSLLLLKGITNIPFARETAELICFPDQYNPAVDNTDLAFWKRVVHFESRYWSIDQLLSPLSINNVLELSSGYSFRGLSAVRENPIFYIDTDLPNVINQKRDFIPALGGHDADIKGHLEMFPLNALDEKQFHQIVNSFPNGPLVIVNEGLLMYLNNEEKKALCKTIYDILKARGGYWITGDIYVKATMERINDKSQDSFKDLIEQQRIEDNMFESFASAKEFFKRLNFVIDKEAEVDLSKISSLKYLVSNATEEQLKEMQSHPSIQTSWRLKIEGDL
jgi:hypothetical protein